MIKTGIYDFPCRRTFHFIGTYKGQGLDMVFLLTLWHQRVLTVARVWCTIWVFFPTKTTLQAWKTKWCLPFTKNIYVYRKCDSIEGCSCRLPRQQRHIFSRVFCGIESSAYTTVLRALNKSGCRIPTIRRRGGRNRRSPRTRLKTNHRRRKSLRRCGWLSAVRTDTSVHDPRSFLLLCYADDTIDLLDARP